jgi:hypothetical protein
MSRPSTIFLTFANPIPQKLPKQISAVRQAKQNKRWHNIRRRRRSDIKKIINETIGNTIKVLINAMYFHKISICFLSSNSRYYRKC